jgi:hypothetical protein
MMKNLDAHVRVFHVIFWANWETFEELYIINAFNYTLRVMTSNWSHNYMSISFYYIFLKLIQAFCKRHQKSQNDEQIYMELKNIKQGKTK